MPRELDGDRGRPGSHALARCRPTPAGRSTWPRATLAARWSRCAGLACLAGARGAVRGARTRVLVGLACAALGDQDARRMELEAAGVRGARRAPGSGPGRLAAARRERRERTD